MMRAMVPKATIHENHRIGSGHKNVGAQPSANRRLDAVTEASLSQRTSKYNLRTRVPLASTGKIRRILRLLPVHGAILEFSLREASFSDFGDRGEETATLNVVRGCDQLRCVVEAFRGPVRIRRGENLLKNQFHLALDRHGVSFIESD